MNLKKLQEITEQLKNRTASGNTQEREEILKQDLKEVLQELNEYVGEMAKYDFIRQGVIEDQLNSTNQTAKSK